MMGGCASELESPVDIRVNENEKARMYYDYLEIFYMQHSADIG